MDMFIHYLSVRIFFNQKRTWLCIFYGKNYSIKAVGIFNGYFCMVCFPKKKGLNYTVQKDLIMYISWKKGLNSTVQK